MSQSRDVPPPEMSIVMSVLNGERYLAAAIESILNQSLSEFEFIIINDGSTDETASILADYEARDRRVKVFHQECRGLVDSLNRGCALASGKYIARMDADDIAKCDRLLLQFEFMERNPDVGVVGSAVEFIDTNGIAMGVSGNPTSDQEIRMAMKGGCPFWHPTVVIRRGLLIAIGGYRKLLLEAEDCDLWLRIAEHTRLANLEADLLQYRMHPNQVSARKARQQALSSLAAHAAAECRRSGHPDPLDSVAKITPEVLSELGVSLSAQESAVAARFLWSIRKFCNAGQYADALDLFAEMSEVCTWWRVEPRVRSDLHLLNARILWSERNYLRSICAAALAVIARPVVLARPLKPILQQLRPQHYGAGQAS